VGYIDVAAPRLELVGFLQFGNNSVGSQFEACLKAREAGDTLPQ